MPRREAHRLLSDQSGATAATFGLALFGLVAIGGLGFDYSRLAGMDSELQNAADQAALAGASQLDGKTGACMRASAAATTLVANLTLLANDGAGTAVTITPPADCAGNDFIRFYRDRAKTTRSNNESNANFIEVEIAARTANYAFTPLAGAISGDLGALALAGLGSAICKVPPVMMCNPNEGSDLIFDVGNYVGKGFLLVTDNGYFPGNFGFLANDGRGAQDLREVLGRLAPGGDCTPIDGVITEPGAMTTVVHALNTRFDVYGQGLNQACGNNGALCPPAYNSRKDVIKGNGASCNQNTWNLPAANQRYLPPSAAPLTAAQRAQLAPMGFPRDICHAVSEEGVCAAAGGRIGDGNWDRAAFFESNAANYGNGFSPQAVFGTAEPTRYQVYEWEIAQQLSASSAYKPLDRQNAGGGNFSFGTPSCSPPGIVGSATVPDRRVLPVAVINCESQDEKLNGRAAVDVAKWVDVFLVEPSLTRDRTSPRDIYVEIIRETLLGGGGSTVGQTVRRDIPYLIE